MTILLFGFYQSDDFINLTTLDQKLNSPISPERFLLLFYTNSYIFGEH